LLLTVLTTYGTEWPFCADAPLKYVVIATICCGE